MKKEERELFLRLRGIAYSDSRASLIEEKIEDLPESVRNTYLSRVKDLVDEMADFVDRWDKKYNQLCREVLEIPRTVEDILSEHPDKSPELATAELRTKLDREGIIYLPSRDGGDVTYLKPIEGEKDWYTLHCNYGYRVIYSEDREPIAVDPGGGPFMYYSYSISGRELTDIVETDGKIKLKFEKEKDLYP